MKVSINWMQQFSPVSLMPNGIDELVEKIGAQLGAVEEVIDISKQYQSILVVKVVRCDRPEGAEKVTVCFIDDGGVTEKVDRDSDGLIQVVCGAPNVRADMLAAWMPPGTTMQADGETVTIGAKEIRGVTSVGMLASARELGINNDHSGILEIDQEAKPGHSFAELYKLNDYVIDIENKMFTHRPDLFGQLGVAREVAGIYGQPFKSPDWYIEQVQLSKGETALSLTVDNEMPELVPRFMAVAVANVKVGPSPVWLQTYLSRVGIRPINNIVDLTNYYMMLTAQPLHAYDYDKVKALDGGSGATIKVRSPNGEEKLRLIGDKTIELHAEDIVISSASTAIGLGGVMGGADTEVDEHTTNIILECGNFDMYRVRRVAMAHGLFTDAATRFTKGQSPLQNDRVLARAAEDIIKAAGGCVASDVYDKKAINISFAPIRGNPEFINARLGVELSITEMSTILKNVELEVSEGEELVVHPQFWRTDLQISEDIVEEVGRLYGYDRLPVQLPKRDLTPAPRDPIHPTKSQLRNLLSAAGANELLTYSFLSEKLFSRSSLDVKRAYSLRNALSPELKYFRTALTPSLLDKVYPNLRAGFDKFVLFEMNPVHSQDIVEDGLPVEQRRIGLVVAHNDRSVSQYYQGAPYYLAKRYLDYVLDKSGLTDVSVKRLDHAGRLSGAWGDLAKMYEPARSGVVLIGDQPMGLVGEYSASVHAAFKLPLNAAGFELDLDVFINHKPGQRYQPLSRFPATEHDVTLAVSETTDMDAVRQALEAAVKQPDLLVSVTPYDAFQKDGEERKHLTYRLRLQHLTKTLVTDEANTIVDTAVARVSEDFSAERI